MSKESKNIRKEEILKIIKESEKPIPVSEIANKLKLSRQLIHQYIKDMCKENSCLINENGQYRFINEKIQFLKSKIETALEELKKTENKKEKSYQIEELLEIYADYQSYEINENLLKKYAKQVLFNFESALGDEEILKQSKDIELRLLIGIKYIMKKLKIKELNDNSQVVKITKTSKNNSNKEQAIQILGLTDNEKNIVVLIDLIKNMSDEEFYGRNYSYVFKYAFSYMDKYFEKAKQKLYDLARSKDKYKDRFEQIYREVRGIKKREKLGDSEII